MPGSDKQNKMFEPSTGYVQRNNPFPVTSCGRRRNDGSPLHHRKKDIHGKRMKHKHRGGKGNKTWAGRAIQNIIGIFGRGESEIKKTAFGGRDRY